MRKEVQVMGIGARKAGIGKKSGVKYDFTEVAIAYPEEKFDGMKCETIAIDATIIGDRKIAVGEVLDIVMHQANFKTYVDAIL